MDAVDGVPYLAWNEANGRTLADLHLKCRALGRRVPIEHALLIAEKVATALDHAYNTTIDGDRTLHGLVWPGFVAISDDGEIRLAGFGLASGVLPAIARPRLAVEVGPYIDQEERRSGTVGRNSDVYSVGVMLLELLTGHPPPADPLALVKGTAPGGPPPLQPEILALLRMTLAPAESRYHPAEIAPRARQASLFGTVLPFDVQPGVLPERSVSRRNRDRGARAQTRGRSGYGRPGRAQPRSRAAPAGSRARIACAASPARPPGAFGLGPAPRGRGDAPSARAGAARRRGSRGDRRRGRDLGRLAARSRFRRRAPRGWRSDARPDADAAPRAPADSVRSDHRHDRRTVSRRSHAPRGLRDGPARGGDAKPQRRHTGAADRGPGGPPDRGRPHRGRSDRSPDADFAAPRRRSHRPSPSPSGGRGRSCNGSPDSDSRAGEAGARRDDAGG